MCHAVASDYLQEKGGLTDWGVGVLRFLPQLVHLLDHYNTFDVQGF